MRAYLHNKYIEITPRQSRSISYVLGIDFFLTKGEPFTYFASVIYRRVQLKSPTLYKNIKWNHFHPLAFNLKNT